MSLMVMVSVTTTKTLANLFDNVFISTTWWAAFQKYEKNKIPSMQLSEDRLDQKSAARWVEFASS